MRFDLGYCAFPDLFGTVVDFACRVIVVRESLYRPHVDVTKMLVVREKVPERSIKCRDWMHRL